jgi:peptidyl-prolyl cis-trans isomerase D
MLHFIRERAQGWIAWIIIGLLIIPFALWGINQYFGGGGKAVVATVNGTEIGQREFQQAFYEQRTRMQQMLGAQYDPRVFEPQLKKRVIDDMVNRELLLQNADAAGYRISDQSVVDTIHSIDAFRENGVFSAELYHQQVRAQGQTPTAFEHRLQRAILTSQLPMGLDNTAFVTDAELDALIRLQEQKRALSYLVLQAKNYQDKADASEQAVADYYEAHRDRYQTPEKVRVEYVELDAAKLGKDVEPTEAQLQKFYQERASQFTVPEERRARHILIQIPQGADEATVKKAKAKAEALLKRIRAGESFEALAKADSDDPGSAKQGGDLGFFGRGVMEPDFEKAAFALKVGEVSEPVLTSFGYHLIKLEEIRPAKRKSFAEVKDELRAQFRQDAAEREYFDLSEKLTNLAYETPDSLATVADKLGLQLKESPFITRRGGSGIFSNPRLAAAAFSDDVLKQGYNSEPIEVGENHVVVLRVKEHQDAAQRPLQEVKAQISRQLIDDKARARAQEAGKALIARLQQGEAPATIAKELKLEWKSAGEIGRKDTAVDRAIVSQAFKLAKPTADKSSYGGEALSSGDYALVAVSKVVDGNPATFDKAQRQALRKRITDMRSAESDAALVGLLKANAKISIKSDEL